MSRFDDPGVDVEDFFAEQKPEPPQMDMSALQQIRNEAYAAGRVLGKREGYAAGYAQGCVDTTAAADMKVDAAYMDGKLDGYAGSNTPEPPDTDDEVGGAAPASNDGAENDESAAKEFKTLELDDACHKLVEEVMLGKLDDNDDIISAATACVIRAMIYAKNLSTVEADKKDTIQTVAEFLNVINNIDEFCKVIKSSENEDAIAELNKLRNTSQNIQGNALVNASFCLKEYLEAE